MLWCCIDASSASLGGLLVQPALSYGSPVNRVPSTDPFTKYSPKQAATVITALLTSTGLDLTCNGGVVDKHPDNITLHPRHRLTFTGNQLDPEITNIFFRFNRVVPPDIWTDGHKAE